MVLHNGSKLAFVGPNSCINTTRVRNNKGYANRKKDYFLAERITKVDLAARFYIAIFKIYCNFNFKFYIDKKISVNNRGKRGLHGLLLVFTLKEINK